MNEKEQRREASGWYQIAGIGFEFIAAVLVVGAIGWGLDRWWGTGPWGLLVGGGVGFALGLYLMVRAAGKAFKN